MPDDTPAITREHKRAAATVAAADPDASAAMLTRHRDNPFRDALAGQRGARG